MPELTISHTEKRVFLIATSDNPAHVICENLGPGAIDFSISNGDPGTDPTPHKLEPGELFVLVARQAAYELSDANRPTTIRLSAI